MKKKNLNWLLALLAALALVFAFAGCADNGAGDSGSSGNPTDETNPSDEEEQDCCDIEGCTPGSGCTACDSCSECASANCCGSNACTIGDCGTCYGGSECTGEAGCSACDTAGCTCSDCAATVVEDCCQINSCTSTDECTECTECETCQAAGCCGHISVAGLSYEYTGVTHTTSGVDGKNNTLDSVTLEFGDTYGDVDVTVVYTICEYNGTGHATECNEADSGEVTFSTTYSVSGNVVSVTLPADASGDTVGATNESAVTLGLTQQNDDSLLVTSGSSYIVKDTDSDGIDLFVETENAGGLSTTTTSTFALSSGGEP